MRAKSVGYALIPVTGLISPLLVLPAITTRFGQEAWVAVAIGQSVGTAFAVFAELGWSLTGPQRVARMRPNASLRAATLSLQSRVLTLAPLIALATLLAWAICPGEKEMAALVASSTILGALSLAWFFLGKSEPWLALALDAAPRLCGLTICAIAIWSGGPLWFYPIVGLAVPALVAASLSLRTIRKRAPSTGWLVSGRRLVLASFRSQAASVVTRAASATYIALPITLVSIVAPSSVAVFASAERLMRIGLAGMAALPNAMQGWVGSAPSREERLDRSRRSILLSIIAGAFAAALFGLFAPLASEILFSGVATISPQLAWLFAIVILIVCTSRATGGIALVARGKLRALALSAVFGALVGVPMILVLANSLGAAGGALGEISAEFAVLAIQVFALLSFRGRR